MPRVRIGVALLVPEPVATEVDGLRRALGDGALGRIPAHLTLVPPVNVDVGRLDEAGDVLRSAASSISGPLELTLGPVTTFWPVTPVAYLAVAGDLTGLTALRDRVFRDPLARALTHEFVPHVTLADEVAPPERIEAAVGAMADYRRTVAFPSVHLLRETPGRVWEAAAEAPLGPARVVGRGGLPVELTVSSAVDGLVSARLAQPVAVVVTARREGEAIGLAHAVISAPQPAWLVAVDVAAHARRTGVGSQLVGALASALAERGVRLLRAACAGDPDAAGFLARMGFRPGAPDVLERTL